MKPYLNNGKQIYFLFLSTIDDVYINMLYFWFNAVHEDGFHMHICTLYLYIATIFWCWNNFYCHYKTNHGIIWI